MDGFAEAPWYTQLTLIAGVYLVVGAAAWIVGWPIVRWMGKDDA
jgi:hypothetical protein